MLLMNVKVAAFGKIFRKSHVKTQRVPSEHSRTALA